MPLGPNYIKLFQNRRLVPGIHDRVIDQHLAFFKDNHHEYEDLRKWYKEDHPVLKGESKAEAPTEEPEQVIDESENELSIEEVNAQLEELGIEVHHRTGEEKRRELLAEALTPDANE